MDLLNVKCQNLTGVFGTNCYRRDDLTATFLHKQTLDQEGGKTLKS